MRDPEVAFIIVNTPRLRPKVVHRSRITSVETHLSVGLQVHPLPAQMATTVSLMGDAVEFAIALASRHHALP